MRTHAHYNNNIEFPLIRNELLRSVVWAARAAYSLGRALALALLSIATSQIRYQSFLSSYNYKFAVEAMESQFVKKRRRQYISRKRRAASLAAHVRWNKAEETSGNPETATPDASGSAAADGGSEPSAQNMPPSSLSPQQSRHADRGSEPQVHTHTHRHLYTQ